MGGGGAGDGDGPGEGAGPTTKDCLGEPPGAGGERIASPFGGPLLHGPLLLEEKDRSVPAKPGSADSVCSVTELSGAPVGVSSHDAVDGSGFAAMPKRAPAGMPDDTYVT